jgi:hypothetical protein
MIAIFLMVLDSMMKIVKPHKLTLLQRMAS